MSALAYKIIITRNNLSQIDRCDECNVCNSLLGFETNPGNIQIISKQHKIEKILKILWEFALLTPSHEKK